jgi:hypothetical protein
VASQQTERRQRVQRLIDQAALFHVFVAPHPSADRAATRDRVGSVTGIDAEEAVHRFDLELDPRLADRPLGLNTVGEQVGRASLRWSIVPEEFVARPDRDPPATPLDLTKSQRFTIQDSAFSFGSRGDGFRVFGAGRTFPMWNGTRGTLWAAAVANIQEGFGAFRSCSGNLTICGDLTAERGFVGHMIVRVLDPEGSLRVDSEAPPPQRGHRADADTTYLTWIGQKAAEGGQDNSVSLSPTGEPRGFNIPADLKRVWVGLAEAGDSIRARDLRTGDVIGLEVGFGREPLPRTSLSGTALLPNRFEGVAKYTLYGPARCVLGTFTTNVLEGRSFSVTLPAAPEEPGLRFGFFAPVVDGTGCFDGVRGMLYGAAGSVLAPPPFEHLISNLYVLRLMDPEGRFRG